MYDKNEGIDFLSTEERLGAAFSGGFLFLFGFPFTLAPFMILPNVYGEGIVLNVFIVCFTLPFLCAGLLVQFAGCASIIMALFPESKFTVKQLRKRRDFASSREPDGNHHSSQPDTEEENVDHQEKPLGSGNFWNDLDGK